MLRRLLAALLLLLLSTPNALGNERDGWTLSYCEQYALQHSPLIAAAEAGLNEFEELYREAWWAWFPNIQLRTVGIAIPPQGASDDSNGDGIPDGPDLTAWNAWSRTDLEAYAPLYTFGKISAARQMADHGVQGANAAIRIAKNELSYQVRRAWYGVLLSTEMQRLVSDGEEKLRKAKERLERLDAEDDDSYDQADAFRLRIYEATVHQLVLDNERLQQVSRTGLRVAMALAEDTPLLLNEAATLEPLTVEVHSLDRYLQLAEAQRPELELERHRIAAQQADVDRYWAAFWPDFFIAGSFTVAVSTVDQEDTVFSNTVFNALGGGATLGLRLTLDYPQKVARYRRAQAKFRRAQAELEVQRSRLRVELETVWREAKQAQEMLAYRNRARRAARALLVLKTQEYENGIDDSVDFKSVLDASVGYLQQKSEWLRGAHSFNMSIARLSRVVGIDVASLRPAEPN